MLLAIAVVAAVGLALLIFAIIQAVSSHAATVNCVANPSGCGFPAASNTGVPKGVTLKKVPSQVSSGPGWHYDTRGWVEVDGNGAVLSGLYIPYNLDISASNVTIKNTQVLTGGGNSFGISVRHTSNVTIEDSTISGLNAGTGRVLTGIKDVYADSTGLAESAVQLEAGLVQDNYIHNTGFIAGDHTNGVTSNGGNTGLLTIQHNTILVDRGQTDAIGLFEDFGIQSNRVITGNLLAGGAYALYAGQNQGGLQTTNITVTNNRFATNLYPKSGAFGAFTAYSSTGSGNTWSGNIWDSTGLAVPAP
jgi:hypothetical protein